MRQIKCAAVLKFFKPADAGFFTPIGSRLIFWRPAKNRISNRVYTEKGETKTGYRSAAHAKRYAMTPNNTVLVADYPATDRRRAAAGRSSTQCRVDTALLAGGWSHTPGNPRQPAGRLWQGDCLHAVETIDNRLRAGIFQQEPAPHGALCAGFPRRGNCLLGE